RPIRRACTPADAVDAVQTVTRVAARTAVVIVVVQLDAVAAARGEPSGAGQGHPLGDRTGATDAGPRRAGDAARAAVGGIRLQVHTHRVAGGLTRSTDGCGCGWSCRAGRAHGAHGASAAHAA